MNRKKCKIYKKIKDFQNYYTVYKKKICKPYRKNCKIYGKQSAKYTSKSKNWITESRAFQFEAVSLINRVYIASEGPQKLGLKYHNTHREYNNF